MIYSGYTTAPKGCPLPERESRAKAAFWLLFAFLGLDPMTMVMVMVIVMAKVALWPKPARPPVADMVE